MKNSIKNILKKNPLVFYFVKLVYCIIRESFLFPYRLFKIVSCRKKFYKLLQSKNVFSLYIMHSRGGGTETYLRTILDGKEDYIILRNVELSKHHKIFILEGDTIKDRLFIFLKDILKLKKIIGSISIENLCGYNNLPYILKVLPTFSVPISFKVHDYYSFCPSITLIKNDSYCGLSGCDKCIFSIDTKKYTGIQWQEMWRHFFYSVSSFYVFSKSSKSIFLKMYPFSKNKIFLKPHSLTYFKSKKITSISDQMNIGIFGNISSEAKGLTVISNFIEFSKDKNYKIYINGKIRNSDKIQFSENCINAGLYSPDEIYSRIVEQQIGVVFFTSIWPETFSYLVSELISIGIPIACFDIGAQAEKVRTYHLGEIIPDYSSQSILKTLTACYEKGREFYTA